MKRTVLLLCLLSSYITFSQDVIMDAASNNTRVNQCSGVFYDSGGAGGDYANNETYTVTICPDALGKQVQLDFTAFNVETNVDVMTIYNGPDTTYDLITAFDPANLGVILADLNQITTPGQANPEGCLTFVFNSNGTNVASGWVAAISCIQPCQDIQAQIDSTVPAVDANDIVRVCQGEEITFNGSGAFSIDGTGASYELFMGDGVSITGALINDEFSTNYTYANEGIYLVSLVIYDANPMGCSSTNISDQYVHVSSTPDFTGTEAVETTICLGESTTIDGMVAPVTVSASCANGGELANLGSAGGQTYTSTLDLNCFQGQTLTDVSQLVSICINMEHDYLGDLDIIVESPSGQRVTLVANQAGLSYNLGDPKGPDGSGPGIGWDYCFSMSAAVLLSNGPRVQSGHPSPGPTVEAGTYLPVGDFASFVGSTIDGQWTLEIVDNANIDDGTIFGWSLNFDENLLSTDFSFTPTITAEAWDADASILNPGGNPITVQPTTAGTHCYTYRVTDDFGCEYTEQVCIEVLPEVTPIIPTPLENCDDTVTDGFTVFDLTIKDTEITGGNANLTVAYFETNVDAQNDTNPINPDNNYTNIANSQIIHVRVTETTTGCFGFTTLILNVLANPLSLTDAPDLELCDDTNPGDNQEVFDVTLNETYIINGEPGVTATYYESVTDAQNGTNAISNPTTYTNSSTPQTIYVRVENDTTGCFTVVDFDIIVNPLPLATVITDFIVCEVNFDGVHQFDLDSKTAEVLNGQNPVDFVVTYHLTQADADAIINPLVSPYTNLANPQIIFVAITNVATGCSISTESFNIEERNNAAANSDLMPIDYVLCDNIDANDGIAEFDLSTQDAFVLDGQDPIIYNVTYFESQADADANINQLSNNYENIQNPQTIYARVDDVTAPNTVCYATTSLTLQVNLLPEFNLDNSYVLCVNTNGTEVVGPPLLDTGLPITDYTFVWSHNGTILAGTFGSSYLVTQSGDYDVTVTDNITNCTRTISTTVIDSSPPLVSATVSSLAFSENNIIEVTATGSGVYEYSLDGGPWQTSNVFENVSTGEHIVTVRDLNGCGIGTAMVIVMDYPKYFTPNGDGYHDTWNIAGINTQPNARIFIYDRYGKLLKQLSPTGIGWNGTFNGANLPASDYWFTVEYIEPSNGELRQFKAHFALKR